MCVNSVSGLQTLNVPFLIVLHRCRVFIFLTQLICSTCRKLNGGNQKCDWGLTKVGHRQRSAKDKEAQNACVCFSAFLPIEATLLRSAECEEVQRVAECCRHLSSAHFWTSWTSVARSLQEAQMGADGSAAALCTTLCGHERAKEACRIQKALQKKEPGPTFLSWPTQCDDGVWLMPFLSSTRESSHHNNNVGPHKHLEHHFNGSFLVSIYCEEVFSPISASV